MGHGGSDVFLSYARQDLPRVRPLVAALEGAGLTVFYDRRVPAGMEWREFIGNALAGARCALVVWTCDSVKSQWVLREAGEAQRRGMPIIPVLLDAVEPPFGFADIQASDLSSGDAAAHDAALDQLVQDIKAQLTSGDKRVTPEANTVAEDASARPVELRATPTHGGGLAREGPSRERVRRNTRLFVVFGTLLAIVIGSFVGRLYHKPAPVVPPIPGPAHITDVVVISGNLECPPDFEGLRYGQATKEAQGARTADDVNRNMGGDTVGVCVKYAPAAEAKASSGKILTDLEAKPWPNWKRVCQAGWKDVGPLTTRTRGPCARMGLCARWGAPDDAIDRAHLPVFSLGLTALGQSSCPGGAPNRRGENIQDRALGCGGSLLYVCRD